MNIIKRYNLKRVLLGILWIVVASGSVVLLIAAMHKKELKRCKGLEIDIRGVSNNFFIDKKDVEEIIVSFAGSDLTGISIKEFDLVSMEAALKNEVWIKNAELFFDNNAILQASVEEREPVARVFDISGNSFYIDDDNMILPLSEKLSARLPVFTGFPSEAKVLSKADSNLLNDIKTLGIYIHQDSFLMAMIDQVDITAQRNFEMIPKIGNQVIVFGDATDAAQKFKNLQLFYKKVMTKYGWNRYSMINLQYKGQVVAKIKGADDVSADSMRTVQIMHAIAENASRQASDSIQTIIQDNEKNTTDISIIQQSMERDETNEPSYTFEKLIPQERTNAPVKPAEQAIDKPVLVPVKKEPAKIIKPLPKPVNKIKPVPKKPVEKPKAVMPKNDY